MSFHFHLFLKSLSSCHFTAKRFKQDDSEYYSRAVKRAKKQTNNWKFKAHFLFWRQTLYFNTCFQMLRTIHRSMHESTSWRAEYYIMSARTVRTLDATVLMNMMKLFTLVCGFVVDLPRGRRLYCSNPGGNNSLASDSNGGDALNVITSMTSQMYVTPSSKRSMHQAALSTPEMLFFSPPTSFANEHALAHATSAASPHAHIQTQTRRYKRTWESFLPPNTICCFFCARICLWSKSEGEFFSRDQLHCGIQSAVSFQAVGRKKKNYSSRSHSKTGAHAHTNTHTRTQTWFASVVDSTEQFYAALISPVVEDSGKDVEVSVWQGVFEEVP